VEIAALPLKLWRLERPIDEVHWHHEPVQMALRAKLFLHIVGELDVIRTYRKPHRLEIKHAASGDRPFDEGRWQAKILLPVGGQQHAHPMSARGMTADIKTISVATEAVGVLVSPGNRPPHLVGHHEEVAASLDHIVE